MSKNNNIKRELFLFSAVDYYSLKEYFEAMARKGWLIDKIKFNIAIFRRIEPIDYTFSVDVYPKFSMFEAVDDNDVEYYKNLCEDAGWSYATSSKNLHIFYSNKEDNLTPIQTDEEIKKMVVQKSILPEIFTMALVIFLMLFNIKIHFPYDYENLFSNMSLIMPFYWPLLLINSLTSTMGSIFWLIRAKKNIKSNKPLPKTNFRKSKTIGTISFVLSLILLIIVIVAMILDSTINSSKIILFVIPILLVPVIAYTYNKEVKALKISNLSKILLLFTLIIVLFTLSIFSALRLGINKDKNLETEYKGLTYEDFDSKIKPRHTSFDREGSILVPKYLQYREVSSVMGLETIYIEARGNKIAKYVFDGMLVDELRYNRVLNDASNEYIGYDEAYYIVNPNAEVKNNSLFLLKDNKILFIDTDFDLSQEKYINIIINKFR
ncbi:DUF2812 domain-containing protein [Tissierella sp. Yu-01]|uniref:DUF2812 domain-containing protein n=1 Tax=Tissierella sp. Yu-01 TaxID=3035694 RepID=UPI00240CEBD7|nr:DUF2812 domain-containing protein [Tissierella sp. Yu-01]WFA08241.1 DUF2812 domain-containing protein [Tissierella sp. Yu-01]